MDKSASAKKELIVKIELFVILPSLGLIVSAGTVRFRQNICEAPGDRQGVEGASPLR